VRIPAEFRFSTEEVYIERDSRTGALTLSEKPLHPSVKEVFRLLDEAGAADFEIPRLNLPPAERDWERG
jgi:antitoxin VapB